MLEADLPDPKTKASCSGGRDAPEQPSSNRSARLDGEKRVGANVGLTRERLVMAVAGLATAAALAGATASAAGPAVHKVKLPSGLGKVEEVIAYKRSQLLLASRYPPSLVRVNADGSLDRSFGDGGRAMAAGYGVTVLPDGKILLADAGAPPGEPSNRDAQVTRLLSNGQADPSFGTGGRAFVDLGGRLDSAKSTAIAPNGDVLVGGTRANVYSRGSDATPAIARLNPDGSVDRSFGDDGVRVLRPYTESGVYDIAPAPDGGVIGLTGAEEVLGDELWKLTADGSIDRSFGKRGVVALFVPSLRTGVVLLAEMEVLPNGRILLAGTGEPGGAQPRPNLAEVTRLLPNGKVDRSYGHRGWAVAKIGSAFVEAMTTLPGGSLLLTASSYNSENETSQLDAVAFAGDGRLDRHFGRGGRLRLSLGGWNLAESVTALGRRGVVAGRVGRHGGSWLLTLPPLHR